MGYHDPIERVASWLRPAVPEDADIVIGVDGGSADGCVASPHRVIAQRQIDQILRFFSAPPHRFLTCEEVVALGAGSPEPLTVPKLLTPDEIAALKAQWEALNIGPREVIGGGWIDSRTAGACLACGCPERTQSHCDRCASVALILLGIASLTIAAICMPLPKGRA